MEQILNEKDKRLSQFVFKIAVLLLVDVFDKFRNNSLKNHGLCPSHYLSAPALNWNVRLNVKEVGLEVIPDPDLYILFKDRMRRAVSYIYNRYSKASNKYLKSYDQKQESKCITYLDASNVCGYGMSKFLPTSCFKLRDPKEFGLNKYTSNSSKGCVLEVDLEYPKELRELHNPLTQDKTEIKREMLSNYQLEIADLYNILVANVKKLVHKFFGKEKYVIHHENLQLCLRIGLKLKKIHRVLIINAVYGKKMENLRIEPM